MNISEYIRDLLLFHEKLILPGLGIFEIVRKPAALKDHEITPPESSIIFTPSLTAEDDTLVSKIADAEETEPDEAKVRVSEFINDIRLALNRGEIYYLQGLGTLQTDETGNYIFRKDENLILDFETGSFEPFELEPVDESYEQDNNIPEEIQSEKEHGDIHNSEFNETAPDETFEVPKPDPEDYDLIEEKKSNLTFIRILSGSIVVILLSFIILALTTDFPYDLNPLNWGKKKPGSGPLYILGDTDEYETDIEAAIDSITRLEHALRITDESHNILIATSAYSEYHIIAGSFSIENNADELQKELSLKGFPSVIINRGDGFYRVSALSFPDKEKALQELENFRKSTKCKSAWVMGLN